MDITYLFDPNYAQAMGSARTAAVLTSMSLPLVHRALGLVILNFLFGGPPPPLCSLGVLQCLFSRVGYVSFSAFEDLGLHRIVQHVLLLDERPIVHVQAINPLKEVASHLQLPLCTDVVRDLWNGT